MKKLHKNYKLYGRKMMEKKTESLKMEERMMRKILKKKKQTELNRFRVRGGEKFYGYGVSVFGGRHGFKLSFYYS